MMILRSAPILAALGLWKCARADIAPEITTIEEGYNLIAKIPCLNCPFLYQDTSKGANEPWTERQDQNALLLNISLPYNSAFLSINNAQLYTGSSNLPQIFANQVVQDLSVDDLRAAIDSNQLEASHETNLGGGFFGLSYRSSLRRIKGSAAFLFHFDIIGLWSDLPEKPLQHKMDDPDQKKLELILHQNQLLSAGEPGSTFEIIRAELVPRSHNPLAPSSRTLEQTMHFQDWDAYGRKGTASHFVTSQSESFITYISSGVWGLFIFMMSVIALFVVVCLLCIFGWGYWGDEYGRAQHGKRRGGSERRGGSGGWRNDIEAARGRFKSAEELGLMGRGQIIGVGKSD